MTKGNRDDIIVEQSREGQRNQRNPSKTVNNADMAELADALDSGSSEVTLMQVQVLLSAPYLRSPAFRMILSKSGAHSLYPGGLAIQDLFPWQEHKSELGEKWGDYHT